ncbi:MAG: bifunctional 5,10-methylenetetrahydrofolate dehydrogenase/5,10-methenyltetrahydrofolate cyclohydrolase [Syntrophomonas sp.]
MKIISGSEISQEIQNNLRESNEKNGLKPCLAIIIVGDNKEDLIYVGLKNKAAALIGGQARIIQLAKDVDKKELLNHIYQLNDDNEVDGILLQLPLPAHLEKDREEILAAIHPAKDVDGFCPANRGLLSGDSPGFISCAALAAMEVIERCHPDLTGKKALLIGDSFDLIIPLAVILIKKGCQITVSPNYAAELMRARDIVVIEKGGAGIAQGEDIDAGSVIIDAGFYWDNNRVCGNVNRDQVGNQDFSLLPVPGGIGPLLIAKLMSNLTRAAASSRKSKE